MGICCHGSAVMGLMGMFNLIFLITVGLSVAVDYFAFSSFFADSAQQEVLEHARLILRTAMSVRSYTEDQIQPIITQLDPKSGTSIRSGCLRTPPWRVLSTCTPRRRNTATGKRL